MVLRYETFHEIEIRTLFYIIHTYSYYKEVSSEKIRAELLKQSNFETRNHNHIPI